MDKDLQVAIVKGRGNVIKNGDSIMRLEHVVYGILSSDNIISEIIRDKIQDGMDHLLADIDAHNKEISIREVEPADTSKNKGDVSLDVEVKNVIQKAKELNKDNHGIVTLDDFFVTVLDEEMKLITILNNYEINKPFIVNRLNKLSVDSNDDELDRKTSNMAETQTKKNSKTPNLDSFGRDLTNLAAQGKLDPVIGREIETERVAQILSRRKKNNPVLIGDPGVGKTAIAEQLALKIIKGDCPPTLQNKRVISLEMSSIVAGTKYRGQFEDRMKAILEELRDNPDTIIFIDEIHTMIGAGNGSGSLDAANILKPALSRGEIQCIGATTLNEYRESFEKDGALERRFQKVIVKPTTLAETTEILMNIKNKYEDYHHVTYTDAAIHEIVRLADRYLTDREFPDKAIDIMDEAGSHTQVTIKKPEEVKKLEAELKTIHTTKKDMVANERFEEAHELLQKEQATQKALDKLAKEWKQTMVNNKTVIDEGMVADTVTLMVGFKVAKIGNQELQKLLTLEDDLNRVVIGQKEAVEIVSDAIQLNRTGIAGTGKPQGVFLFLGSTGVGKTELAKQLAESVFDDPEAVIRIDMGEYSERHNVSRLIGSPPGYVGYNEGGQLTEKVRRKPYSVVLLDEVDKAHPSVFDIFMRTFDEGTMTDGTGKEINFRNTIIIMTSNVGVHLSQQFASGIGFAASTIQNGERQKDIINKELKKRFKPEFLNRIDEVIFFNKLEASQIEEIAHIQLDLFVKRLVGINYTVSIGEGIAGYLKDNGYDSEMGVRPMQRALKKLIQKPIAQKLLQEGMPKSGTITVELNKDENKVDVSIS